MSLLVKSEIDKLEQLVSLKDLHPKAVEALKAYEGPLGVACSGGPDSVLLLLVMVLFYPNNQITVFHFNHKTRPGENEEEEVFVRELASILGLKVEVGTISELPKKPSEDALRKLRLRFFHQNMKQSGIEILLLGQHLDDLGESFLINLSRGSGAQGLSSPKPVHQYSKNILHIRPLMSLTREQIMQVLEKSKIAFCIDSSNEKTNYFRNKLRKDVIPGWKLAAPTHFYKGLALSREQLEEDAQALKVLLDKVVKKPIKGEVQDLSVLVGQPKALLRRAIRNWLEAQEFEYSYSFFKDILENFSSENQQSKVTSIGDKFIKYDNYTLRIAYKEESTSVAKISLQIDRPLKLSNLRTISAEIVYPDRNLIQDIIHGRIENAHCAYVALEIKNPKLYVRSWHSGDSYRPLNGPGTKKVQDLFTDKKIPLAQKSLLPFILYGNEILWIPNFPINHKYKVSPEAKWLLKLTYI